jgi:hypothetical protein
MLQYVTDERALDYTTEKPIPRKNKHEYDQDQTIWHHMLCILEEANTNKVLTWQKLQEKER